MTNFTRIDGCSGGTTKCEACGKAWKDHVAPASQCPCVIIDRELVQTCVDLLNLAFSAECDAFGVAHNLATDTLGELENLLT